VGKIGYALGMVLALVAFDAQAGEPPIGVGEVTAAASSADVDEGMLRAMVEQAVGELDTTKLPRHAPAVLSVSVVRLDSRESPSAEVTCVVSATLRDRAHGSVFAIVEGSARGQDDPRRIRGLQRATLRAAVTSAVSRVPDALRQRAPHG
jgi:hypothetical protein